MRYINYARRSSDEKSKKQVQSIEDQLSATRGYALHLGLSVVEEMTESRSAKEPGRPVFNAMIEKIRKGEAEAILCWKLDRLARNPIDAATLRWMMRQGLLKEIRTPHQVYSPDDNAVIAAVESAMAEQYIIDLKIGVERGMHSKCEKGGFPFMAPQGYLNDRLTQSVEVDQERFPVLRQAWDLLLSEKYTISDIYRILTDQWGYRGRVTERNPGGKLSVGALRGIFRNPFYKGQFIFQGQLYAHRFPPMVTPQEWDMAQQILNRRAHKTKTKRKFAFSGLIVCASCGYRVTAEVSKGHIYYHCVNKHGICTKKGIREEKVAQQIADALDAITLPAEFEEFCDRVLEEIRQDKLAATEQIQVSRQKALQELQKQKEALLTLYLKGLLTAEEYGNKKGELTGQENGLQAHEGNSDEGQSMSSLVRGVARFATTAKSQFEECEVEEKRLIARKLATTYLLNNGNELQIELHPFFEPVRSSFKNQFTKIEPSTNGCQTWKCTINKHELAEWYTTLSQYPENLLQDNCAFQYGNPFRAMHNLEVSSDKSIRQRSQSI